MITGYKRVHEFKVITKYLINDNIIKVLSELDKEMYEKELLWDNEYQKEVYKKYKKSLTYIKYKNKIIGYINILPIKEEEYLEIISKHDIKNNYEHLGTKNSRYYIIDSIVLKEKYQNELSIKLVSKILKKRISYIKPLNVISIAVNEFENEVLKNSSFKELKKFDDGNYLYILK